MDSVMTTQQQQQRRKSSTDETNSQYHYTFTPNQLEALKKNMYGLDGRCISLSLTL